MSGGLACQRRSQLAQRTHPRRWRRCPRQRRPSVTPLLSDFPITPLFIPQALWSLSCCEAMFLPEITERLSSLLGLDRSALLSDEVKMIEPRQLADVELGWVQAMLSASDGWETADLSLTRVVAEGPNSEGLLLVLQAPAPENPGAMVARNSIAQLWINTDEQITMIVQLAEYEGKLQELYVLIVDSKHPRRIIRTLPVGGVEVSRDVVGFS
jgi:hypothetical protein